ncbi:hypothetical protein EV651_117174 [Kribbella sp. VKM Ac-2571]|uniref:hypothetical protein n=1 Tax=Kribbella sp. VKM Ac-2571 TaxID=2512222 RepID=UPI0010D598C5|nr:hypothetical protein [Kribbella sp. VKM Ac-2571]TDO52984.1 hypothetical protein EV651_117174 [Kribbella sp. VKM Ac-2571]
MSVRRLLVALGIVAAALVALPASAAPPGNVLYSPNLSTFPNADASGSVRSPRTQPGGISVRR